MLSLTQYLNLIDENGQNYYPFIDSPRQLFQIYKHPLCDDYSVYVDHRHIASCIQTFLTSRHVIFPRVVRQLRVSSFHLFSCCCCFLVLLTVYPFFYHSVQCYYVSLLTFNHWLAQFLEKWKNCFMILSAYQNLTTNE